MKISLEQSTCELKSKININCCWSVAAFSIGCDWYLEISTYLYSGKIVYDMLKKNELIRMKKQRVIELLGNEYCSEQISFKISKKNFPPETTLIYYLGVDFIDNNWFILSTKKMWLRKS